MQRIYQISKIQLNLFSKNGIRWIFLLWDLVQSCQNLGEINEGSDDKAILPLFYNMSNTQILKALAKPPCE